MVKWIKKQIDWITMDKQTKLLAKLIKIIKQMDVPGLELSNEHIIRILHDKEVERKRIEEERKEKEKWYQSK